MKMTGLGALVAYVATIPAANWMVGNVGTECIPGGPCLIPVGFGFSAPSGVLMIGAALALRDLVHREFGTAVSVASIGAGAVLSTLFSPPALVLASVFAFVVSELLDLAVYAPLARRRMILAIVLSGVAGAVADSVIFQAVAFGTTSFVIGQTIGKLWGTYLYAGAVWMWRGKS